jgi:hypothetical protein
MYGFLSNTYKAPVSTTYGENVYAILAPQIPYITGTSIVLTSWNRGYSTGLFTRVNCAFSTPEIIKGLNVASLSEQSYTGRTDYLTVKIYGTNDVTEYNYTSSATCNGTFLFQVTPSTTGLTSYTTVNSYLYFIIITVLADGYTNGAMAHMSVQLLMQSEGALNYTLGTDFTLATSSSNGAPVITYTNATTRTLFYSLEHILIYEAYRRLYPVVRDKNQIVITDGTNTVTLTSTSGYPISKASDVTITSVADGNLLVYNFFQSKFFCTGLRLCLWPCRF